MIPTRRGRRSGRLPELRTEMDRLLNEFFDRPGDVQGSFAPTADAYETDGDYVIEVELPGFDRDSINVSYEDGALTVTGRRDPREEGQEYHLRERPVGRFQRRFSLPRSIDADDIEARADAGVLRVTVPKSEEARPREIEVEVS